MNMTIENIIPLKRLYFYEKILQKKSLLVGLPRHLKKSLLPVILLVT